MIIVIAAKDWLKNKKKLVDPKDYIILDCTDGQETSMRNFSETVTVDDFCIPSKLLSVMNKDIGEEYVDLDNVETLEKNFFRGNKFASTVLATVSAFITAESDINIFIVIRNKAFKFYRKRFITEFCRVFPDISPYVHIYEDKHKDKIKKILVKDLEAAEKNSLIKELKKKEKEMEETAKPKLKKDKKKKKKKNNKGWGFSKNLDF